MIPSIHQKRVLITGVTGCIGANLAQKCVQEGACVFGIIRGNSNTWRINHLRERMELNVADLADFEAVRRVIEEVDPDYLFHCAVERSTNLREAILGNVLGTANLLKASEGQPALRFIHMGSSQEYGPRERPLSETDSLSPVTPYAAVKVSCSLLVQQAARNGRVAVILRPFHVYGPWELSRRLIPTAIRSVLNGNSLDLTAPGICHDYVFVDDVVEACLDAVQKEGISGEAFNIGTGINTTNEEIVRLVCELTERRLDVNIGAYEAHSTDRTHWSADVEKAERLLGWKARHTLRAGLEKTIDWIRRQDLTVTVRTIDGKENAMHH